MKKANYKILYLIVFLAIVSFCASVISQYIFGAVCSFATLLFVWAIFLVKGTYSKDEKEVKRYCKRIGFLLLPPSLIMIATIASTIYFSIGQLTILCDVVDGVCAVGIIACLCAEFASAHKANSISGRIMKSVILATVSAPFSLFIASTLFTSSTGDELVSLMCLTSGVMGAVALLIALNLILISFCNYQTTRQSIQMIVNLYKRFQMHFLRAAVLKDIVVVIWKLLLSIISFSFFMFVNALFSASIGFARAIAINMQNKNMQEQIGGYRQVGLVISAASVCYVVYSIRLLFGGSTGQYPLSIALIIALYTFVEFGINIKEVIVMRKSNALEAKALRAISLSGSLLCFVLTQTAIMSFTSTADNRVSNAVSGVFFGALSLLVGLWVVLKSCIIKRKYGR